MQNGSIVVKQTRQPGDGDGYPSGDYLIIFTGKNTTWDIFVYVQQPCQTRILKHVLIIRNKA